MIILGAGGHAKEVLGILAELQLTADVCFYDNIRKEQQEAVYGQFPVIHNEKKAIKALQKDPRFIIGVGKPALREKMANRFLEIGGRLTSVISPFARIGSFEVILEEGLNIMTGAVITQNIIIGKGTLIHINTTIHHDCRIGNFCELSPGCHILGKVKIGNLVSVGSGAVILPGLHIGDEAVIGAGSVVTADVPKGVTVKGAPAKL
ncbi:acetyltransferase [Flavitalea flava]